MDLLVRLIIKIFEAVFEKDTRRRAQARPSAARGEPQRSAQRAPMTLEDWLRQIEGQAQPSTQAPSEPEPPPIPQEPVATVADADLWGRPDRAAPAPMAWVPKQRSKAVGRFRLPGSTPLEQAIYAQLILEPCLGLRFMRRAAKAPAWRFRGL